MAHLSIDISRLEAAIAEGRLARGDALEEIEHQLDRAAGDPVPGLLDFLLRELHDTPSDAHLLRLLARLYERDEGASRAKQAIETAHRAGRTSSSDSAAYDLSGDTTSVRDHLVVARVLLEAGLVEAAAEVTQKALAAEPNGLAAVNLLAKIRHVQGRLTETIRLWVQLQMLSPNREGALAHLGILHRIARDDDSASPFMAVGEDVYARKYEGQVELERAFAKFGERDFAGAIAQCDTLAARTRAEAPAIYKLAVLQKAWIQERTGELASAQATLHALGRERGFETDLDRLGFLAKVCERIGGKESLEQAVHIHEHLSSRHGKLSALSRLASLYEAVGKHELAAQYTREYERRFARRMQKPSPPEILRALALHYVPLAVVETIDMSPDDLSACSLEVRLSQTLGGRRRRRALLAYLVGAEVRAEALFTRLCRTRLATHRDFAYLGDLHARRGSPAAAVFYGESLRRGGASSVALWDRFLDVTEPRTRPALSYLLSPDDVLIARRAMLDAARQRRAEDGRWEQLAALEGMAGDREAEARHLLKARAIRHSAAEMPREGRVLAAAVYNLNGKRKGLVHELVVTRREVGKGKGGTIAERDIVGHVTPDFRALVRRVLEVTKDYARAHFPHLVHDADAYRYVIRVAKDDEPSSGSSAGLPIAVAFLSLLLGKPVPAGFAFTGAITSDAQSHIAVQPVGDALYKVKGAYHANLRAILVPLDNRGDVERDGRVPIAISRRIARYVARLDDALELVWGPEIWDA